MEYLLDFASKVQDDTQGFLGGCLYGSWSIFRPFQGLWVQEYVLLERPWRDGRGPRGSVRPQTCTRSTLRRDLGLPR